MNFDPQAFNFTASLLSWVAVFGICLVAAVTLAACLSIVYAGSRAPSVFFGEAAGGLNDLFHTSPRRVFALAMLTLKEAIRRKALLVFVVFAILFMFGGWFLTNTNERADLQVKVYVAFVLTATAFLLMPVVLLLSTWGIPEDIRARSLHTVVTKPVRRNEVVLGRILGFTAVGTLVLGVMSLFGYVWIVRQVPAEAQSELVCRVPVFGVLNFIDRQGNPADRGINVGDVWDFNSFIEGATKARAIWSFKNVTPASMVAEEGQSDPKLKLESRFHAFRTYKGNMDRSLLCQLVLTNEKAKLSVPLPPYEVKEFGHNVIYVDRKITYYDDKAKASKTVDLFDDVAPDGTLRVEARCLDPGQFLGMARPGLFLRTPDQPFASGFFKSIAGIWLMMVLTIVIGVTASCFVKGPVAMVLTFVLLLVGTGFHEFLDNLVAGKVQGGGTFESVYRIIDHKNPVIDLEPSAAVKTMKAVDKVPEAGLWLVSHIIPNFTTFWMSPYVANGFDVPFNTALLPAIATVAAYLIPCLLLGYFSLRLRELEAK